MATGAEHYLEAESILTERLPHYELGKAAEVLAEAQVHATLALAAATAAAAEGTPGVRVHGYGAKDT